MTVKTAMDMCRELEEWGVSPIAREVAHAIGHWVNADGIAYLSVSEIARKTGRGRTSVKRALRELVRGGWIQRVENWNKRGDRGANGYSFGRQWDLFLHANAARRERWRAERRQGGGGAKMAPPRATVAPPIGTAGSFSVDKGAREHASNVNGNGNGTTAGEPERCGRTFDIEEYLERTEAARVEATRRGFGGPWDDASVAGFLRGAERRDA